MVSCHVIGCSRTALVIVNFDVSMKSETVAHKIKTIVKLFNIFSLLDSKYLRRRKFPLLINCVF